VLVVLDANVFVSAAIQRGASYRIVESWLTGAADFKVVMCPTLLDEIRDPEDDYLIALARANDVEFIISGDNDLLEWGVQQPPAVTPSQFEQRFRTA